MKLDLGNIKEQQFTGYGDVTDGWHTITVKDSEEKEGPKGTYYNLTLEVTDANDPGHGSYVWAVVSFSQKALPNTKAVLRILNFNVDGSVELTPTALIGRRAQILTRSTPYMSKATADKPSEERTKSEVREWAPIGTHPTVIASGGQSVSVPSDPDDDIPLLMHVSGDWYSEAEAHYRNALGQPGMRLNSLELGKLAALLAIHSELVKINARKEN